MILDIGCGWNPTIQRKRRGIGIDIKKGMCDIQADAHYLPFRNATFSKVYLIDILEHLEDPIICLKEVNRVTQEDTKIYIRFPIHANTPWTELKRCITSFPFGLIDTFKLLKRRLWTSQIEGATHKTHIKPKDVEKVFTIKRITKQERHAWFQGRKGRFLSKLLNGFVMRVGYNYTIEAHKNHPKNMLKNA